MILLSQETIEREGKSAFGPSTVKLGKFASGANASRDFWRGAKLPVAAGLGRIQRQRLIDSPLQKKKRGGMLCVRKLQLVICAIPEI